MALQLLRNIIASLELQKVQTASYSPSWLRGCVVARSVWLSPLEGPSCRNESLYYEGGTASIRTMAESFPRDISEAIGQFQIVESDETPVSQVRTGTLRFEGNVADLEVSPEITPSVEWEVQEDGSWVGHSRESEQADFTVLGTLARSPSAVSLWRTNTFRRRSLGFSIPGQDNPGSQEMRADWCITGAHLADPTAPFSAVHFDIANLHEWSGHSYAKSESGLPKTWIVDFPETEAHSLQDTAGTLELSPRGKVQTHASRGLHISTNTLVKITLEDGVSLDELVAQYGRPLAILMTLLTGAECSIREIDLRDQDNQELQAYGKVVDREAPESPGQLFLTRRDVSADLLTSWITTANTLSPVPEILASLWSGVFPYLETRSLTLATSAEALHRLLHPDAIRFTAEEVDESIRGLDKAMIPVPVKNSLQNALKSYWAEKSYPQRLEELAEPVVRAVPTSIGKLNRWKRAVSDLRVQLAHGFTDQKLDPEQILKIEALSRSLQWVLTFRVLLHSGVTPSELGEAAKRSERYQLHMRRWNKWWPNIFASDGT